MPHAAHAAAFLMQLSATASTYPVLHQPSTTTAPALPNPYTAPPLTLDEAAPQRSFLQPAGAAGASRRLSRRACIKHSAACGRPLHIHPAAWPPPGLLVSAGPLPRGCRRGSLLRVRAAKGRSERGGAGSAARGGGGETADIFCDGRLVAQWNEQGRQARQIRIHQDLLRNDGG